MIVLVHSPLIGRASWGVVPDLFAALGTEVITVDVRPTSNESSPAPFIGAASVAISQALATGTEQVLLVGQHEAGPLLPHLGNTRPDDRLLATSYSTHSCPSRTVHAEPTACST